MKPYFTDEGNTVLGGFVLTACTSLDEKKCSVVKMVVKAGSSSQELSEEAVVLDSDEDVFGQLKILDT